MWDLSKGEGGGSACCVGLAGVPGEGTNKPTRSKTGVSEVEPVAP